MQIATYIFLAIAGLVAGGAIVWVMLAAHPFETPEEPPQLPDPVEPAFLAAEMTRRGRPVDEATASELLNLHLDYLEGRARANTARADEVILEKERAEFEAQRAAEERQSANAGASPKVTASASGSKPSSEAPEKAR